jgi:hypothetical protein
LQSDAAFLHASIHAAEVFMDTILDRQYPVANQNANKHAWLGIRILRKRLASTAGQGEVNEITNSTLAAVLVLALSGLITADIKAFQLHMQALHDMVTSRGGIAGLRGNKLLVEIFRYDLSGAILFGTEPVFFSDPKSEPLLPYPDEELLAIRKSSLSAASDMFPCNINDGLAEAWSIMQRFSAIANLAVQIKESILPQLIYDTMASVMYRLLRTTFDRGSINETIRLGLLAFTHHIFLRWEYLKTPNNHLAAVLRYNLQCGRMDEAAPPKLRLWLLMVSAVSLYSINDESWLRAQLKQYMVLCGATTWVKTREALKSLMWIDLLHEKAGATAFDAVSVE